MGSMTQYEISKANKEIEIYFILHCIILLRRTIIYTPNSVRLAKQTYFGENSALAKLEINTLVLLYIIRDYYYNILI